MGADASRCCTDPRSAAGKVQYKEDMRKASKNMEELVKHSELIKKLTYVYGGGGERSSYKQILYHMKGRVIGD